MSTTKEKLKTGSGEREKWGKGEQLGVGYGGRKKVSQTQEEKDAMRVAG